MGRRSPSRAGLLDGSSLISSNNYYCHGRSDCKGKKKVYTSSDVLFFTEKMQRKVYTSSDVLFFTETIGETVA